MKSIVPTSSPIQKIKNALQSLLPPLLAPSISLRSVICVSISKKSFPEQCQILQRIHTILAHLDNKTKFEWKLNMKDNVRQHIMSLETGDRLQRATGGDPHNYYLKELLRIPTTQPGILRNVMALEYNLTLYECLSSSNAAYINENELNNGGTYMDEADYIRIDNILHADVIINLAMCFFLESLLQGKEMSSPYIFGSDNHGVSTM